MLNEQELDQFIENALYEDVRGGDHTSLASIDKNTFGQARLLVKDNGILCGLRVAEAIFAKVDPTLKVEMRMDEGAEIRYGDEAFHVSGSAISILTAERLVLNCMQRMSGIATRTREYVNVIAGTKAKVADTRKTTPNIRFLEKYAVTVGGGVNHRIGLYDMILLKDNHIDFCGGISQAILKVNHYLKVRNMNLRIEVETRSLPDVEEVLKCGNVHRIMLDNFKPADVKEAVQMINGQCETEASGGITLDTIREFAETGVDFISVGALTHSVRSLDLSLKAVIK